MKIIEGEKGIGMSETHARSFLRQSKTTLLIGTTNRDGTPVIHPVWYYFNAAKTKLYFYTEPELRKARNLRERNRVYFDVDVDRWPYKGVKGSGKARILTDTAEAVSYGRKILARYVRKGQPLLKSVIDKIKSGGYIVVEITPEYFTTWDYGKVGMPDLVASE